MLTELGRGLAKTAFAGAENGNRLIQRSLIKFGPELVGEIQL